MFPTPEARCDHPPSQAKQPGAEGCFPAEAVDCGKGCGEGLLNDFFGVVGVANPATGKAVHPMKALFVETIEGGAVTASHLLDQREFGVFVGGNLCRDSHGGPQQEQQQTNRMQRSAEFWSRGVEIRHCGDRPGRKRCALCRRTLGKRSRSRLPRRKAGPPQRGGRPYAAAESAARRQETTSKEIRPPTGPSMPLGLVGSSFHSPSTTYLY